MGFYLVVIVGALLIPLLTKAPWTLGDFIVAGVLLVIFSLFYEFARAKISNPKSLIITSIFLVIVFLYIWAELAVGVFTTWGS
ncbi:MAG: hypothetical protein R3346_03555 [Candidatus Spechtbacterales bacterium]|nr:hypothetical protein [Candidatus Spechtbacterales bacterium]